MAGQSGSLTGRIALVAGATRGAGRGIARALGEAGAIVYCSGRSTAAAGATPGRPETIDETAELVSAAGGTGIAVRTDHTRTEEVRALVGRIERERGGLDILVNDVWGGDDLTEWGKPLWEHSLENGLVMLERAVHSHVVTAHAAIPVMLDRPGALIVEVTDGVGIGYRGNLFYDLVKASVIRIAMALAYELRNRSVTAVAVSPGFLRSERMLELFGVTEATWRDHIERDPHWSESETPLFVGRGIAALAADPQHWQLSGRALASWDLGERYGIEDADGRRPHWRHHIDHEIDLQWPKLVDTARAALKRCAPGAVLDASREALTLRAGDIERQILEPELFFSSAESLANEVCASFVRAHGGATAP